MGYVHYDIRKGVAKCHINRSDDVEQYMEAHDLPTMHQAQVEMLTNQKMSAMKDMLSTGK